MIIVSLNVKKLISAIPTYIARSLILQEIGSPNQNYSGGGGQYRE